MDQSVVDQMETNLALAIREVFEPWRSNVRLPLAPDQRTMHLMAKAATAVYEAVASTADLKRDRPQA